MTPMWMELALHMEHHHDHIYGHLLMYWMRFTQINMFVLVLALTSQEPFHHLSGATTSVQQGVAMSIPVSGSYTADPLWDGEGCDETNTCCDFNSPPWFCKDLPHSIYH